MHSLIGKTWVCVALAVSVGCMGGCQKQEALEEVSSTNVSENENDPKIVPSAGGTEIDSAQHDCELIWTISSERGDQITKTRLAKGTNGRSSTKLTSNDETDELIIVFLRHDEGLDYYDVEIRYPEGSMSRTIAFGGEQEEETVLESSGRTLTVRAYSEENEGQVTKD